MNEFTPENNVMLDLETLSRFPNAAIVAIGAVRFSVTTNELKNAFYCTIDLRSSQNFGGHIEADTVL
jgi:hypothetical protein